MLLELKTLSAQQAEQELLQTTRDFHSCKQEEGQYVSSYVLKMRGYINNLEHLRHPVTLGLGVSLILIGLRKKFDGFVHNYNMHSLGKTINELHAMLKLHEQTLPKNNAPALHAIRAGHWKRNCPQYLFELLKKKKLSQGASNSDGFINRFVNNTIQVSRNNMVYFSAIPRDGIFEIDLSNSYVYDSSMYAISNKRAKLDLDSALLWHCRLGKKRIEKLQHDGLLNSTDLRAFEKYVSFMSEKMTRKPYTHQVKRAKDLLGLIYTDEVENQLGKTIKSLRSDREGEYMSQEFLDLLKDHGIIGHCTPPYKPQHNRVSERRNRTLLDKIKDVLLQRRKAMFVDFRLAKDRDGGYFLRNMPVNSNTILGTRLTLFSFIPFDFEENVDIKTRNDFCRVTKAIKAIVVYEAIRMAHDSINQVVRQGITVERKANNKRKFEN
nr:zinc finger, CCHC-type [Tanacetum cinerariifolium]